MGKARSSSRVSSLAATFPIDPTVSVLIQQIVDATDAFSMKRAASEVATRAVLRLSCTNKAVRGAAFADERLKYYLFFYFALHNTAIPRRFLDGTFEVDLLSGSYGTGPADQTRFDVLTPKDVMQDRLSAAKRLAEMDIDKVVVKSAKYMATDLPSGIGHRVAALVGRSRFVTQVRAQARPEWVVTCNLSTCSCRMLCSEGGNVGGMVQNNHLIDLFGEPLTSSSDEDDDDPPETPGPSYWASLSPYPIASLPRRVFCSLACSLKYDDELASAVPVRLRDAETSEHFSSAAGKVGLARTLASTRAAFKRNNIASRALREAARTIKKRTASSIRMETILKIHRNIIDVLNVDLGILYAASSLAESPGASTNRQLPATTPGWREGDLKKFTRAIERVKSTYTKYWTEKDGLARDERFVPKWLIKCREDAGNMFPVRVSSL
jgi:hypothetical protein